MPNGTSTAPFDTNGKSTSRSPRNTDTPLHSHLSRPFRIVFLKYGRNKSTKARTAIFACATTREIHLEIIENASAEAFLQALRHIAIASHHDWPDTIISDNGGWFVGADTEIRSRFIEGKKRLQDFAVLHKINWKFIIPLSSHQGGMHKSFIN